MNIKIVSRKCTPDEKFKARADKKLAKIDRLFGEDAEAKITVSTQRYMQIVEITVVSAGTVFRAQESAPDMIEALDKCVDRLISQISKNKTKVAKRLRQGTIEDISALGAAVEEETEFDVIRTKTIPVKPLSVDDAILEMNIVGHQFYMFINDASNKINIVYKRKGGGYGLLEPEV